MGINIGIMEMEAPSAPCRALRSEVVRVHMADVSGFEEAAVYDEFVPYDKAKAAFPDWEAFVKRNRLNEEADAVYLGKIKRAEDLEALAPLAERRCTGWVVLTDVPGPRRDEAVSRADDRVTGWDCLDFDGMNEMCGSCPLSWDKGRGCIGAFGPDNSLLPEIASRHGCPLVASVPQAAAEDRRFSPDDAEELLREVGVLRAVLPEEGKMMVRRYSGPVDRLEAVARISMSEGCGFHFFRRRRSGLRRTSRSVMFETMERTPLIPRTSSSYSGDTKARMIGSGFDPHTTIPFLSMKSTSWL